MSLMSRIASAFSRKTVEQVLAGQQSASRLMMPQNSVPEFDMDTAIRFYKSWVYTAANRNAVGVASTPLRLYATKGKGQEYPKIASYRHLSSPEKKAVYREGMIQKANQIMMAEDIVEIMEHPFIDLMKNVNPEENQFGFMEETILWLDCTGDCYWYMIGGTGLEEGIPKELWILPTNKVRAVPGKTRLIEEYKYGNKGSEQTFEPEEVIRHHRVSLRDRLYGYSRTQALWDAVWGYQAIENFEAGMAKNPVPPLMAYFKGALTVKQKRELERELSRTLDANARNQSSLAGIMDSEGELKPVGISPRDIAMLQGRQFRREEIVNGFGQSMALYTENPNRANIEGAIYLWGKFELDPAMTRISQKINEKLLPRYAADGRLFCAFDKIATNDPQFMLQQDQMDVQNKIRAINEIRKARGLLPFDNDEAEDPFAAGEKMAEALAGAAGKEPEAPTKPFGKPGKGKPSTEETKPTEEE